MISKRKVGSLVAVQASINEAVGAGRSLSMRLVHELSRRLSAFEVVSVSRQVGDL